LTDEANKVEPDKPKKAEPRMPGGKTKRIAIKTALILLALLMLLLLLPVCGCAQTITGKVVGVSDGRNRVPFKTEAEAQAAGFRKAKDCPQ